MKRFRVRKSSGNLEPFSTSKIERSLIRCGTPVQQARIITRDIRSQVYPNMPTEMVRRLVLRQLKQSQPASATRYQLSRAVMKLGPTGFPFEKLIAQLYEAEGHQVLVNQIRQGRCANHEIDVIAKKAGKTIFVECKFHQEPASVSDLKTALYVKARADDLKHLHDRFALVTNTRFSSDALGYGLCAGLEMVGWTEPQKNCLSRRLESVGLIPLTALTSLPHKLAQEIMLEGIITIRDLVDSPRAWNKLARHTKLLRAVQNEIDLLFQ